MEPCPLGVEAWLTPKNKPPPHFSRKLQIYLRVFNAPAEGIPFKLGISTWGQKTRMMELPDWEKKIDDIFSCLDTIHEIDGWTDRQTDTGRQQRPRLLIASCGRYATNYVTLTRGSAPLLAQLCHEYAELPAAHKFSLSEMV